MLALSTMIWHRSNGSSRVRSGGSKGGCRGSRRGGSVRSGLLDYRAKSCRCQGCKPRCRTFVTYVSLPKEYDKKLRKLCRSEMLVKLKRTRHVAFRPTVLILSHIVLITLTKLASSDRVKPPSCSRQLRSTFRLEGGEERKKLAPKYSERCS